MMKKTLILLLIIFVFALIRIYPLLMQEGNPLPIVKGIIELNIKNEDIVKISTKPDKYITKTAKGDVPAIELMVAEGWNFDDQAGSGYIFSKSDDIKIISNVQYTGKYRIWTFPTEH